MADNVTLPATGTGTAAPVIATDDVAGVHYQAVKIALGADGAIDNLVDSGQQTMSASIPVVLASNQSSVPVTEASASSALTSLQLIDDPVATLGTTTYTEAATKGMIVGAVRRDADTTLVDTTNEVGPLQMDANGRLKVEVFSGETLPVSGAVTETNSGAALTALQLIDDAVQVLGTDTFTEATSKGLTLNAVRRDADTTLVDTTNEFAPLQVDANGRLKVEAFSGETLPVSLTSTTITGTVAVTQSGTWDEVGINDSGNSITVDAPVGTPVNVQIGNATLVAGVIDETGASAVDALAVGGGTAHDAVNSGNPLLNGFEAIAHGTNPTAVAAADRTKAYANRAGIPFMMGGHPNIVSAEYFTSGAITDDNVLPAISAGTKYVLTSITVTCSAANTTNPSIRLGFGTTSVPAQGATNADAVSKVVLSHPGIPAGGGIQKGNGSGIVGIGGDGEELRITCTTPTTSMIVQVDYFTIES